MIEKIKDNLITIIGILLIIISISVVMYDNYKDNQKVLENVELVEDTGYSMTFEIKAGGYDFEYTVEMENDESTSKMLSAA